MRKKNKICAISNNGYSQNLFKKEKTSILDDGKFGQWEVLPLKNAEMNGPAEVTLLLRWENTALSNMNAHDYIKWVVTTE